MAKEKEKDNKYFFASEKAACNLFCTKKIDYVRQYCSKLFFFGNFILLI